MSTVLSTTYIHGPLVTIAIPTYNRASLLKGCIDAALAQTYTNFEILVSDNASTDATQEVLERITDKRLRVVRQKSNIGLVGNWNACLANAAGAYTFLVPDDDRIAPWLVERCVKVIEGRSDIPIVVALSDMCLNSIGRMKPAVSSRRLHTGISDGVDILSAYLTGDIDVVAICSVMVQTAALRRRGGFLTDYVHATDVVAWAPLLFDGRAGFVNERCATMNFHSDTETARLDVERKLCEGWRVVDLLSKLADEHVADQARRRRIKMQARRCFSQRGFIALSLYRNKGASISNIAWFLWKHSQNFIHFNLKSAVRFLAAISCPKPVADLIRLIMYKKRAELIEVAEDLRVRLGNQG